MADLQHADAEPGLRERATEPAVTPTELRRWLGVAPGHDLVTETFAEPSLWQSRLWALLLVVAVCVLLLCYLVLASAEAPPVPVMTPLAGLPLVLALALAGRRRARVYASEHGLVIRRRGRWLRLGWPEVLALRRVEQREQPYWQLITRSFTVPLTADTEQGRRLIRALVAVLDARRHGRRLPAEAPPSGAALSLPADRPPADRHGLSPAPPPE